MIRGNLHGIEESFLTAAANKTVYLVDSLEQVKYLEALLAKAAVEEKENTIIISNLNPHEFIHLFANRVFHVNFINDWKIDGFELNQRIAKAGTIEGIQLAMQKILADAQEADLDQNKVLDLLKLHVITHSDEWLKLVLKPVNFAKYCEIELNTPSQAVQSVDAQTNENSVEGAQAEVKVDGAEVTQLQAKVMALVTELDGMKEQFMQKDTKCNVLEQELEKSKESLAQVTEQLKQSEEARKEYADRTNANDPLLEEIRDGLKKSEAELVRVVSEFEKTSADLGQTKGELERTREELERTSGELEKAKVQVEDANLKVEQANTIVESLKSDNTGLQDELRQTISNLDDMYEHNQMLQGTVEDLQELTDELETALELRGHMYEKAALDTETTGGKLAVKTDVEQLFPIISENTLMTAKSLTIIKEVGNHPYLEDIIQYFIAKLSAEISNARLLPLVIIADPLDDKFRLKRYQAMGCSVNQAPQNQLKPADLMCVTDTLSVADLRENYDLTTKDIVVIVDRYGTVPYARRSDADVYELINAKEYEPYLTCDGQHVISSYNSKEFTSLKIPEAFNASSERQRLVFFNQNKVLDNMIKRIVAKVKA